MKFYRDSETRQRVYWVLVPPGTPALPVPHTFLNGGWNEKNVLQNVPPGRAGEDGPSFKGGWSQARAWRPRNNHYCGTPRQWAEGSIAGDPLLVWTPGGYSTCCKEVVPLGTPRKIGRFGEDGTFVENARGLDDPDDDMTVWDVGQGMPWLDLVQGGAPANPDAGRARPYLTAGGVPNILYPDGSVSQVLTGPAGVVLTDTALLMWNSSSQRAVSTPMLWNSALGLFQTAIPIWMGDGFLVGGTPGNYHAEAFTTQTTNSGYMRWVIAPGTGLAYSEFVVRAGNLSLGVREFGIDGGVDGPAVRFAADSGEALVNDLGFDIRGRLVYGVPSAASVQTALGLGSAAYEDTTAFDPAGSAATAQSNAESYADAAAAAAQAAAEAYADATFVPLTAGVRLAGTSWVATRETTTSATPGSLTTAQTVSFTLAAATTVMVQVSAVTDTNSAGAVNRLTVDVDGVNTQVAATTCGATGTEYQLAGNYPVSLGAGNHTITLEFSRSAGTAGFSHRSLVVTLAG